MTDDDVKSCLVDLLSDMMSRPPLRAAWLSMSPDERRTAEGAWEDLIAKHGAPPPPQWGLNAGRDEDHVLRALRCRFNEAWRRHYPLPSEQHHPRPMGPEEGHARTVARWLLASVGHDVTAAIARARALAQNMFREDLTTAQGAPWRWSSVAKDPGRFFSRPSNPSRVNRDRAQMDDFDRRLALAEAEAAPLDVARAALEAVRGGGR